MWLHKNNELTLEALVRRLFRVFDVRVTTSYMSKVRKGWCTRALQNWQLLSHKETLCRVQWSMDALRSKETFDSVKLTDETSVEMVLMGGFLIQEKFIFGCSAS